VRQQKTLEGTHPNERPDGGNRSSVGLLEHRHPCAGSADDLPTILSGVITGFGARPSANTSIGKVFQDRAARYADKAFLKFGDETINYRQANETVNRYAALLAARGVGHGLMSSASCCATHRSRCC